MPYGMLAVEAIPCCATALLRESLGSSVAHTKTAAKESRVLMEAGELIVWWQDLLWEFWNGLTAWIILIVHVFGGWKEFPVYTVAQR
jgi:hypothetical protein